MRIRKDAEMGCENALELVGEREFDMRMNRRIECGKNDRIRVHEARGKNAENGWAKSLRVYHVQDIGIDGLMSMDQEFVDVERAARRNQLRTKEVDIEDEVLCVCT